MDTPFHPGELAVQARAGVREKMSVVGARMIRDFMPDQHRELFEKLPTLIVGSQDAQSRPWASVLAGRPGFMRTPHARALQVNAWPQAEDPLAEHLHAGARLGLLGIEPHTRRRNRMNGHVAECTRSGFVVEVAQSFGNCPRYIHAREPRWVDAAAAHTAPAERLGAGLNDAACALLARADTVFIASAAGPASEHGPDVSHRGGHPGFVRPTHDPGSGAVTLTLPDYAGNQLFNTLGNLAAHPWAGLLVIDPERGDLLQLCAAARIVWDGPLLERVDGAQRLVQLQVVEARWRPAALPLRWTPAEPPLQLASLGRGAGDAAR